MDWLIPEHAYFDPRIGYPYHLDDVHWFGVFLLQPLVALICWARRSSGAIAGLGWG